MGSESPDVVLYDSNGNMLAVQDATAIPAGTPALLVAGSDGTNSRFILIDGSARQIVAGAGTAGTPAGGVLTIQGIAGGTVVPVSGTVTANIGTTGGLALDATLTGGTQTTRITDGTNTATVKAASTAAVATDKALVVAISPNNTVAATQSGTWTVQPGNTANTTPWLTTINQGGNSATVTAANALKVDGSAVTQPVSGTVTANAGTGNFNVVGTGSDNTTNSTAKLPVLVARANTAAPTWTDTNMVPLSVDTAGSLRVTGSITASNASIGINGAAIPTSSTQIGGTDGTNLQPFRVFDVDSGAGTQYVQGISLRLSASGGSVEFGTATNPIRIDPTGTTTQPVSGTVAVTQATPANLRSQTASESTTATATGTVASLTGGAVTTAAPTYTTGQMNPLSLTTGGLLRVDGSGVTQPVSGTITANIGTTNGLALDATLAKLTIAQGTALGTNTQALVGGSVTTAAPTYTTGQISPFSLTTGGALRTDSSATTQPVSGTVTVTQSTAANLRAQTAAESTTATSTGTVAALIGGAVTTAAPTYTTGQMDPLSLTTTGLLRVDGSGVTQPVSGTVTANIGTTGGLALDATLTGGTQTTRITDGTNTATVKAASTAAVATDKALVVAISPNNSVVVTQATAANLNAQVQGAGANGAAVTGNPVLMAGSDGTNARTIKTLTDGTQVTRYKELATFTGVATDIAVANNKSMLSIVNASGSTVTTRISAIYVTSVQTTTVTGVVGNFELRRITNHSAGTAITAIEKMDSNDSLNASITVRTNGTVTSESANLLWRSVFSTDEWSVNAAIDTAAMGHLLSTMFPIWKKSDNDNKPIILNANEGLTVKFATNSAVGTFDIMIVFTQE